jgi:hypothetical protein
MIPQCKGQTGNPPELLILDMRDTEWSEELNVPDAMDTDHDSSHNILSNRGTCG